MIKKNRTCTSATVAAKTNNRQLLAKGPGLAIGISIRTVSAMFGHFPVLGFFEHMPRIFIRHFPRCLRRFNPLATVNNSKIMYRDNMMACHYIDNQICLRNLLGPVKRLRNHESIAVKKFQLTAVRTDRPKSLPGKKRLVHIFPAGTNDRPVIHKRWRYTAQRRKIKSPNVLSFAITDIQIKREITLTHGVSLAPGRRKNYPAVRIINRRNIMKRTVRYLPQPTAINIDLPDVKRLTFIFLIAHQQLLPVERRIKIENKTLLCFENNSLALFRLSWIIHTNRTANVSKPRIHRSICPAHSIVFSTNIGDTPRLCHRHLMQSARQLLDRIQTKFVLLTADQFRLGKKLFLPVRNKP